MNNDDFSRLYKKNEHQLFLFAQSLCKSSADARDLLQETAIKAYQNIDKLDKHEKFKSWVSTILHHNFISKYRKGARRMQLLSREKGLDGHFFNKSTSHNIGYEKLKADDIRMLSSRVGKDSMKTFRLYYAGYSYKEIAEKLGIAMGTVKSRINFARNKMKTVIIQSDLAA
jgi:RNA polymerase sigma-70 factor (ECF subfamily)